MPTVTVDGKSDAGAPGPTPRTTPDKPPIIVTVTAGTDTCGAATGRSCPTPGACSTTCNFISVRIQNSSGNRDCNFSGTGTGGVFADGTITADGATHQTSSSYGGHGGTLTATCSERRLQIR